MYALFSVDYFVMLSFLDKKSERLDILVLYNPFARKLCTDRLSVKLFQP